MKNLFFWLQVGSSSNEILQGSRKNGFIVVLFFYMFHQTLGTGSGVLLSDEIYGGNFSLDSWLIHLPTNYRS